MTHAQRRRIDAIARGRCDEALFLLEGPRAVADALRAGVVAEVWLRSDPPPGQRDEILELASDSGVAVGEGEAADFERLGRTVTPQGVLALVRDTCRPVEDVLGGDGLLLWLDGLQDPGNVGAVMRVAAAFGVGGVLLSRASAHPLGLKALRASAGLALRIPFARDDEAAIRDAVAARGLPVWLLERGGEDLFDTGSPPAPLVLVAGSEGRGATEAARSVATRLVGIPLAAGVDSLNAAVAVGIAVSRLMRGARGRAP